MRRRIAHGLNGLDTDLRDFAIVIERLKRIFQYKKYSIFCIAALKDKSPKKPLPLYKEERLFL
jgi:hypothetical protein